jgi:predicted lipid-binding transport protein (Tim44 family)
VVLCSPDRKTLESVQVLAEKNLSQAEMQKVMFFQPEHLFFYLEKEAVEAASEEARVRGYKVKVHYQPVNEAEKKAKREAVANVIIQALKRMKEKK